KPSPVKSAAIIARGVSIHRRSHLAQSLMASNPDGLNGRVRSNASASAEAATLKEASRREIARSATAAIHVAAIVRKAASRAGVARIADAGARIHNHRLRAV